MWSTNKVKSDLGLPFPRPILPTWPDQWEAFLSSLHDPDPRASLLVVHFWCSRKRRVRGGLFLLHINLSHQVDLPSPEPSGPSTSTTTMTSLLPWHSVRKDEKGGTRRGGKSRVKGGGARRISKRECVCWKEEKEKKAHCTHTHIRKIVSLSPF